MHSMIKTKMKRRRGAFQGQCADYVSHKAGGKSNKLCGKTISGHPMYGGGEQNAQCSKQYGSGGGELNSEGEGTGIVPFPYQGGYGSCSYQGFFTYTSSDHDSGRTTCRKACDRVQHCKYFAHNSEVGSGFNTNYCTLFNSCQTWAKTNAGWPGGLLVPMFKCKPGCTGTTCSADAGWVDKADKSSLTCGGTSACSRAVCCNPLPQCSTDPGSCPGGAGWKWQAGGYCSYGCADGCTGGYGCRGQCCTELPSCQETPCLNTAGWKDKDPKTGLYCDSSDSSCEHDCCEPLSACASSHCVAENGWTPKQNITDLFCDATGDADANTCQEDCCDKLPDCSTDYGTDASCNEVAPPAPQLWARKTEAQAELYCAGDSCTREECCNGVCDSSFCGAEMVLNSTAATVRCEGVACNVTVCCVQKPATVDARTDSDRENGAGDASAVQLGEEDLIEERRVREK
mmetsp:Transcript_3947/g.9638  ORF Transcript_3947/g.9638 Transcript_3947/m.9638 type:complete len:457 (+) Transcript_3947:782-2152(+)